MKIPPGMVPSPGIEHITVEGSLKVHKMIKEWRERAGAWEHAYQPEYGLRASQLRACANELETAVKRYDIPPFMPAPPDVTNRSEREPMTEKTGAALIMAERVRQVNEEHWTPSHDEQHSDGELVDAAIAYAASHYHHDENYPELNRVYRQTRNDSDAVVFLDVWPQQWEHHWDKRDKTDHMRSLVKAGALIAAEIDRIHHATVSGKR